jgi:hypothetical protein
MTPSGGQHDQRGVVALGQLDEEVAVGVALGDVDDADLGEGADLGEAAAAAFGERAVLLQGLQHVAQRPALLALQPEGLGERRLVGLAAVADVFQQGLAVGDAPLRARTGLVGGFGGRLARGRFCRFWRGGVVLET